MGCCFSCGSDSNEISNNSKETVYKFDNPGFDKPPSQKAPISNVSDSASQYKKKQIVVPNISVTPASPEIIETGIENQGYNPNSGDLGLDEYEEYPNYEPLRRMSADIREQKEKEEKAKREKEAQISKVEPEETKAVNDTKVQNDNCSKQKDSEASFNTVYHTAKEASEEAPKINEEVVASKTTVTVEVHSSSSDTSSSELPQASTIELPEDASRKFSQLAPAPKDGPLSQQVGQFSVTPTEGSGQASPISSTANLKAADLHSQLNVLAVEEEFASRKFSQLAPAPSNSPHAVQVGGKFTMIPTEAKH